MPRTRSACIALVASLFVAGCAATPSAPPGAPAAPSWPDPVRVAVAGFVDESGAGMVKVNGTTGPADAALSARLRSILSRSQAFTLSERNAASLLVYGVVKQFSEGRSGRVAFDLQIVDRKAARLLASSAITGTPGELGPDIERPATRGLSARVRGETAIDKATRAAAIRAANLIAATAIDRGLLVQQEPTPGGEQPAAPLPPTTPPDTRLQSAQLKLDALGYDCGPPDGLMGGRTGACIEAYQLDMGLEPTGVLDDSTASELAL